MTGGWTYGRTRVGRRRLLADAGFDSALAEHVSLDLHSDGAGVWAAQLNDVNRDQDPEMPAEWTVSDELVTLAALSGILRLAQHARDTTGAGGNAEIRAALLPADGASVRVGHTQFGFAESRGRVAVSGEVVNAEVGGALESLAVPGRALIATAAVLVDEVGQSFGIPQMGLVTRDGEIRGHSWSTSFYGDLTRWAQQHAIPIIPK